MNESIDRFLEMIHAGNGWYAMQVGLGVVFTALVLVSALIAVTGRLFSIGKQREADEEEPAADAPEGDRDVVAAAVAVALALAERTPRRPRFVPPSGADPWRMAGRASQHQRAREVGPSRKRS
jgi:Na+-transporting methylmalonyl-CoA/oxaloacetate decarboxylase gamma subunit